MTLQRHRQLAKILMGAFAAAYFPTVANALSEDARICAGCHHNVWDAYRRTGMGRSFYRPAPENIVEDFTNKNTFYHRPSDSYFTMLQRDGQYYQRRYQLDSGGKQINVMEKRIDYIMGSGNHARAYLHRTAANRLIELPLGWYAEKGGYWAMNPGYDRPDHDGFRRPITYDCMFCHNAYPEIPAGREQPFAQPVYAGALPEGIDCQRCHGPGARHAKLAGTAGAKREHIRDAIVNPSRLSTQRQLEICMACHLETTSFPLPNAIQRYERGPFSYRPGEPLGDFILNFDHAAGSGREEKFEIVNAAYRLRRSACFLKSNGNMLCTTCHNPHDAPRGEQATAITLRCAGNATRRLWASESGWGDTPTRRIASNVTCPNGARKTSYTWPRPIITSSEKSRPAICWPNGRNGRKRAPAPIAVPWFCTIPRRFRIRQKTICISPSHR